MINKRIFEGVATALITPFCENGIDYKLFEQQLKFQLDSGVDAVCVAGTTGEAPTLDDSEHIRLIECAVSYCSGKIPVIAGSGSNCTSHACEMSKKAMEKGASALLVVTPYYNKANDEGLLRSYRKIEEASSLPIILYNVPSRTGVDISDYVYSQLCNDGLIYASKEASPSIVKFANLCACYRDKMDFICGNDEMLLPTLSLGGIGCISVIANILPKETRQIYTYYKQGNTEKATEMQLKLMPLISALFSDINPIPVKAAMAYLGTDSGMLRLPLCELCEDKKKRLIYELDKIIG